MELTRKKIVNFLKKLKYLYTKYESLVKSDISIKEELKNKNIPNPFIESVNKSLINIGTTEEVIIIGSNFNSYTRFYFKESENKILSYKVLNSSTAVIVIETSLNITDNILYAENEKEGITSKIELNIRQIEILIPGNNIEWQNISSTNLTVGEGSLVGNYVTGWNKQATFGPINIQKSFELQFTNSNPTYSNVMIGINDKPTQSTSFQEIDYCFYIYGNTCQVRENNIIKINSIATKKGDVFAIEMNNNIITYLLNRNVIYTSSISYNLSQTHFDCSFYRYGNITDIKFIY